MRIILIEICFASYFHDLESSSIIWKGVLYIGKHKIFKLYQDIMYSTRREDST